MERNLKETFNGLHNGNFLKISTEQPAFPESWLQIGGNHETNWNFIHQSLENPVIEINNATSTRAGIIQKREDSLDIGKDEAWLIKVLLKSVLPEQQAYLRIYPIKSNGDASKPWEFSFTLGVEPEEFKEAISATSDIKFLRLETGILGAGHLYIYKVIAYPLFPDRMKRRVKQTRNEIHQISHIETIGEITKPIQLATPIPLNIPVTVQANVNSDIRNLTPARDGVQIHGSAQAPLATSACGRAQVEIYGHGFHESLEVVTANLTLSSTTTRDVSALRCFSFAIYNSDTGTAYVQAELSPDGVCWVADCDQQEVHSGKLVIVSPAKFLRYTRLSYWAESSTMLKIWVQAQS